MGLNLTVVRFHYVCDHDNPPLAAWLRRLVALPPPDDGTSPEYRFLWQLQD